MMRKLAIGITVLALSVHGGASLSTSAVSNGSPDADSTQVTPPTNPAASVQVVVPPAPVAPASERTLSANPLWAIPAVPKVVAVPKPRESERPQLTLVGTIAGDEEGFGIFLDQSTQAIFRLKVGEDHQGWTLRSVQGREATLQKDQRVVPLALPQPSVGQLAVEVPPPAANAGDLLSVTSQPRPDDRSGR